MSENIPHFCHGIINVDNNCSQMNGRHVTMSVCVCVRVMQDLVKSYLMIAVKDEVEELRERIKALTERNSQLEYENTVLRTTAAPDVLAKVGRM